VTAGRGTGLAGAGAVGGGLGDAGPQAATGDSDAAAVTAAASTRRAHLRVVIRFLP